MTATSGRVSSRYSVRSERFEPQLADHDFWFSGLSFAPKDVEKRLAWKYSSNPSPGSRILLIDCEGADSPVGAIGLFSRSWYATGINYQAAVAADLVVDTKHRTLGPALQLCLSAFRTVGENEFSFVYGLPNAISSVLKKRLDFQSTKTVVRYSRPLLWLYLVKDKLPGKAATVVAGLLQSLVGVKDFCQGLWLGRNWIGGAVTGFDERFDDLWVRSRDSFGLCGCRDAKFLNWRFSDPASSFEHRVFIVESRTVQRLGGYVVWRYCESGEVLIKDFFFDPDCGAATVMQLFINTMKNGRYDRLSFAFEGSSQLKQSLKLLGFVAREETETLFCLAEKTTRQMFDGEGIYITAADNDA